MRPSCRSWTSSRASWLIRAPVIAATSTSNPNSTLCSFAFADDRADGRFGEDYVARLFGIMEGCKPTLPGAPARNALIVVGGQVQRSLEAVCRPINRRRRKLLREPVTPCTEIMSCY